MSKGNTFENDLMLLVFNATAIANIADNAASSPITNIYLSLHTSDPGEAGSQTTNEATYTSYARVAVLRNGTGWTVASGVAENAALVQFPQCTGGTNTITHVGVGTSISGAGKLLYSGALGSSLDVSNGVQPQFAAGSLTITED